VRYGEVGEVKEVRERRRKRRERGRGEERGEDDEGSDTWHTGRHREQHLQA
jgi:hypothetical protein